MRTEQLLPFSLRRKKKEMIQINRFSADKLSRYPEELQGLSNHHNPILLYPATDSIRRLLRIQKQGNRKIYFDHGFALIYQRFNYPLFLNWNKLPPKTSFHQPSSKMSHRLRTIHPSRLMNTGLQLHRCSQGLWKRGTFTLVAY